MLKSVEVDAVVIASDVMTDDGKPVTAVGVDSASEVDTPFDELVIDTGPDVDIVDNGVGELETTVFDVVVSGRPVLVADKELLALDIAAE